MIHVEPERLVRFNSEQRVLLEELVTQVLRIFDGDPDRDGLRGTPRRYVDSLLEMCNAESFNFTTFEVDHDELILQRGIPFYSLCEHHLLPFFGEVDVGYIPGGKVIAGLSKLPRFVEFCSKGFQTQELMTRRISEGLQEILKPRGIAVVVRARHLCMEMRGVRTRTSTTTSSMTGVFRANASARSEFFSLCQS